MTFFSRELPEYMCEKFNLIKLVSFTTVFAIAFINVYQPFNSSTWVDTPLLYLFYSSLIVIAGFVVIAVSRVVMYYWNKRQRINYLQFGVWILVELTFMALFFTAFVLLLNPSADVLNTFKESFTNTLLIVLIPYTLCSLYFSWVEKGRLLEEREDVPAAVDNGSRLIDFVDERNVLRLSVMKRNVIYIEAADNYVSIYYFRKNGIARFLLRNSLKTLEALLTDTGIVRCHRSYMVNLEYVNVIRRQRGGIFLELNVANVPDIPLSPKYSDRVDQWLRAAN